MGKNKDRLELEKQVKEVGEQLERLQAENERLKELLNMREEEEEEKESGEEESS